MERSTVPPPQRRNGLALLWKPQGPTSQQLLGLFKKEHGSGRGKGDRRGIGHSGTLDPFAEGWLLIGLGEGTKLLAPLGGLSKSYEARMLFGVTSRELDVTGQLQWTDVKDLPALARRLEKEGQAFLDSKLGAFEQIPPQFSAIKVDGERAYEWARRGEEHELKARPATLLEAKSLKVELSEWEGRPVVAWTFMAHVSSGTYIRALARDWGQELSGAPGLLQTLVRRGIGGFRPEQSEGCLWLLPEHLKAAFSFQSLPNDAAQALKKQGIWRGENLSELPCLIADPSGSVVAWAPPQSRAQLGRVFLEDPFGNP